MLSLKKFKNTEFMILAVMWISQLSTFTISMINEYQLVISDYLGFIGLLIVTIISVIRTDKALSSLLLLLFLGVFNILSFLYFFNVVVKFDFSMMITPGIQLFSLLLLFILILRKKSKILHLYKTALGR